MANIRCKNGHIYDKSQFPTCPECPVDGIRRGVPETVAAPLPGGKASESAGSAPQARGSDSGGVAGVTVGLFQKRTGIDPVVGWLVCIKGVNKGRDYRLKSDVNKVGRATSMDVCIEGDETVTRDTHFQVAYSPRNKHFSVVPGDGRSLVYLNGEDVLQAMRLKAYDRIEVGDTTLLFLPLCSPDFDWATTGDDAPKDGAVKDGEVRRPADENETRPL